MASWVLTENRALLLLAASRQVVAVYHSGKWGVDCLRAVMSCDWMMPGTRQPDGEMGLMGAPASDAGRNPRPQNGVHVENQPHQIGRDRGKERRGNEVVRMLMLHEPGGAPTQTR